MMVEEEISKGDPQAVNRRLSLIEKVPGLIITNEAIQIAELLLADNAVPKGSEEDALHIGIAAAQGVDYLLTWNFKHINNAEKKMAISNVVVSRGFICPQLCSPEELGGNFND
jgi:hypothetical protein